MNTANELIKIEKKNKIGIISLNRPELNILDTKMIQEFGDSLTEIENDGQIRAVIITGTKNFSAGADIKEMKEIHPEEAEAFSRLRHKVFNQLEDMKKPVIAAISGYALGGGCEIALACDIRIAGENAKFGQPEVNHSGFWRDAAASQVNRYRESERDDNDRKDYRRKRGRIHRACK